MIVLDVNVVLAAHRADHPHHGEVRPWFDDLADGSERFTVINSVWTSFVRLSTNRRIFDVPSSLDAAFAFVRAVREQPNHLDVVLEATHLETFEQTCHAADAVGDLVNDAYLAAVTLELGATLVSLDRDFARFPELEWRRPG